MLLKMFLGPRPRPSRPAERSLRREVAVRSSATLTARAVRGLSGKGALADQYTAQGPPVVAAIDIEKLKAARPTRRDRLRLRKAIEPLRSESAATAGVLR